MTATAAPPAAKARKAGSAPATGRESAGSGTIGARVPSKSRATSIRPGCAVTAAAMSSMSIPPTILPKVILEVRSSDTPVRMAKRSQRRM